MFSDLIGETKKQLPYSPLLKVLIEVLRILERDGVS